MVTFSLNRHVGRRKLLQSYMQVVWCVHEKNKNNWSYKRKDVDWHGKHFLKGKSRGRTNGLNSLNSPRLLRLYLLLP